jgi:hypothetical protein
VEGAQFFVVGIKRADATPQGLKGKRMLRRGLIGLALYLELAGDDIRR